VTAWRFTVVEADPEPCECCGTAVGRKRSVTVAADHWWDAREHARGVLEACRPVTGPAVAQAPPLTWEEVPQAEAEVDLSWLGHDAGRVPTRKLVVTRRRT